MAATLMPAIEATTRAKPPTVESLRAKMQDLERQRQTHLANANACTGAIQFAQALIVDLEGGGDA
jgi:hypothetical protein